jgi:hypothetical protein
MPAGSMGIPRESMTYKNHIGFVRIKFAIGLISYGNPCQFITIHKPEEFF